MAITHAAFLTQIRNYTEVDTTVLTDSIIQEFIRIVELNVAGTVDYDDLRKYDQSTQELFYKKETLVLFQNIIQLMKQELQFIGLIGMSLMLLLLPHQRQLMLYS